MRADDAAETQVESEATQHPQPGGEAVDLEVAVEHRLTVARRRATLLVEARLEGGDLAREAVGDAGELGDVVTDEGRIGLGGVGVEEERVGAVCVHGGGSKGEGERVILPHDLGLAARPHPSRILEMRADSRPAPDRRVPRIPIPFSPWRRCVPSPTPPRRMRPKGSP
ncbi:hypothetical protein ACH0AH_11305 [Microbacterium paludicola]|uniref:hypothetical protein n=1 Tax=Microbacterium paludicola TaxID=300019 RepID=UPI003879C50D